MKILHLLYSDQFSGAENVVCQIIGMMKKEPGCEMAYCSRDGEIRQALEERGISFVPVRELSVSEVRRVIREQRPDIIHAHDMRASFAAALACGKLPLISHIHNSDFKARRVSVKSVLYLLCVPKFTHIVWVSDSCLNGYVFWKWISGKSVVLNNVINGEEIRRKAMQDQNAYCYDLAYIGRLEEPKNPVRLVRIVDMIRREKPDIHVAIVGSGTLEETVREAVAECHLQRNVDMLGFRKNPLKILQSSKVMVMTSDREGLPMAALEAMALGVPIVGTPTDGLCDIVKTGKTGFLESDEAEFAKKVLLLISDENTRVHFSEATRNAFAKINNMENYRKVLIEIYGM